MQKLSLKRKWNDSSAIVLVAVVVMLAAMLLPYAAARPSFRAAIESLPADVCMEGTDITYRSTLRVSVLEFVKIYTRLGKTNAEAAALGQFCGILAAAMGATAILAGVFAVLKKPLPVLFFNLMSFAVFFVHNSNFAKRELVPGYNYRFGIGYYLFYVAVVVSIAGSIWMLKEKKIQEDQPEETEE